MVERIIDVLNFLKVFNGTTTVSFKMFKQKLYKHLFETE